MTHKDKAAIAAQIEALASDIETLCEDLAPPPSIATHFEYAVRVLRLARDDYRDLE